MIASHNFFVFPQFITKISKIITNFAIINLITNKIYRV